MRKMIFLLTMILFVQPSFASITAHGDYLTSGDVVAPSNGTVLLDTGALAQQGGTGDYYKMAISATCTVACVIEVGVFDGSNAVYKTYDINLLANASVQHFWEKIAVPDGYKIRVRMGALTLGTVNVSMNIFLIDLD